MALSLTGIEDGLAMRKLLLAALLAASASTPAETLIHAGRLIDGASNRAMTERTIRVDGDRIVAIENGYVAGGSGDTVIDLTDRTVMPGLMDMHVHISSEYSANSRLNQFTKNEADLALDAAMYARRTLEAGYTVIRNLGDRMNESIALRNAINAGKVPGPLIFTAGRGIATNGWAQHIMGDPGPRIGVVNSPEDAKKAVHQRYKDGADVIKITGLRAAY